MSVAAPALKSINPHHWRLPGWAVMTAISVVAAHGLSPRLATGVLIGGAGIVFQGVNDPRLAVRRVAVLTATIAGLAACFTAPDGIGEIPVLIAASRATNAFEGRPLRWFVVLDTLAFGATVAIISHSYLGVLAALGVPLLVQRAVEHRNLVEERDRATALLAEVQRGRESQAQAAALQERGRIARDMHDVLAHSLAGLSVQLQALRAVAAREHASTSILEPLDRAADLARNGLAEARAAVSTLRDPVGLGLDALPALIERHPGETTLVITGVPGQVSPEAGHAVYRAVQESLTNSARYAPGSPVTVTATWSASSLVVFADDKGPGPDRSAVGGQSTGLGLAGMGERVQQVDGTLHAGPRPERGWRVEVCVPARLASTIGSEVAP